MAYPIGNTTFLLVVFIKLIMLSKLSGLKIFSLLWQVTNTNSSSLIKFLTLSSRKLTPVSNKSLNSSRISTIGFPVTFIMLSDIPSFNPCFLYEGRYE